jgi:hypothetical protein
VDPQTHHGKLLTVEGTARRVTRIVLDEAAARRWGFDHYYQIDLFVPLGNETIRVGEDDADGEAPLFTNDFPVTVCVSSLPENLTVREDLREDIRVAAVFCKLWAYHSQFMSSYDPQQLQIAPLLIGYQPHVVSPPAGRHAVFGILAGAGFIALLAGLWWGLWAWTRSDRRFRDAVVRPRRDDSRR